MENIILETLKSLLINFYMYFFVLSFIMYSIIYSTYRFWKIVFIEEELLYI